MKNSKIIVFLTLGLLTTGIVSLSIFLLTHKKESKSVPNQQLTTQITPQLIKEHDGINKTAKLSLLTKESIEVHINTYLRTIKKFRGWVVQIQDFVADFQKGSLEYVVQLTKLKFLTKKIEVFYPDNSFKTLAELNRENEIYKIQDLNEKSLARHDQIDIGTNIELEIRTKLKNDLMHYVNTLNGVSGWNAKITFFQKNIQERSLTYKVQFTKENFPASKEIQVNYPIRSIANTIEIQARGQIQKDYEKIKSLTQEEFKKIDGITPSKNAPTPAIEKWYANLKINIRDHLKLTSPNINWNTRVQEPTRNSMGTLSYKVTIENLLYDTKIIKVSYLQEFQTDEEHQWQKDKASLAIWAIKDTDIKNLDQIHTSRVKTPPTEFSHDAKQVIEKFVRQKTLNNKWNIQVRDFKVNKNEGSLSYELQIFQEEIQKKNKKIGQTIIVSYPKNSFQTQQEFLTKKWAKFKSRFTPTRIKRNDGIQIFSNLPSHNKEDASYFLAALNNLVLVTIKEDKKLKYQDLFKGFKLKIKNFQTNDADGSLSYIFAFIPYSDYVFKNRILKHIFEINIEYPANTFQKKV